MNPKVSIVIPTYNRQELLKKAIYSCFAGNESLEIEVIVVDDGSTDGTKKYLTTIDDNRVKPIFQKHQGVQVARNRGMKEANGKYLKFLDDDDQLIKGSLRKEVQILEETGADVCYGDLKIIEPGKESWIFRQGDAPDLISGIFEGKIWTHLHVFLYRHQTLNTMWNEKLTYEQDKDFAIRFASNLPFSVKINKVVGIHNIHLGDRISNTIKPSKPIVEKCLLKINFIDQAISDLKKNRELRSYHKKAAAIGIWQWAHMMTGYSLAHFFEVNKLIKKIEPGFRPNRSSQLLILFDNIFNPSITQCMLYPFRKLKNKLLS